jgi:hypothetical protein
MAKRDEILAVIRERDNEAVHFLCEACRYWWRPLLARYLRSEARRLLALNKRDLEQLPPLRYKRKSPATERAAIIRPLPRELFTRRRAGVAESRQDAAPGPGFFCYCPGGLSP